MTTGLRAYFRFALYLVAVAALVVFGRLTYRNYPRDPAKAPTIVDTNAPSGGAPLPTDPGEETRTDPPPRLGTVVTYGGLAFLCLVGLSLLAARDVSNFFASRVQDFIFDDDLSGMRNPAYEEAERVWTNGQHLEAIQLMRDYLKAHPREQYVALRIAEIYEADLGNHVAAALEYQEILKRKLPPERWGWAAIHLANLYSGKLNKVQEASDLLRRIISEYGQTAAAKKARERLGIPEPVSVVVLPPPEPAATPPPPSNLPPGFRPRE